MSLIKVQGGKYVYDRPAYGSWNGMMCRCFGKKHVHYRHYGGRGITVCERWRGRGGYARFYEDVGDPPSPKHQLDRINNDGNYEPGNVRWVPRKQNCRNRRGQRILTARGQSKSLAEWAEETGQSYWKIWVRWKRGWDDEQAVFGRAKCNLTSAAKEAIARLAVGESAVVPLSRQRVHQIAIELGIKASTLKRDSMIAVVRIS